jgi:hypothetical protein
MADTRVLTKDDLFLISVCANMILTLSIINLYESRNKLLKKKK